ncbi:hypothetical protein ACVIGB_000855 [Bradyrhizobium sp. USDA 4341]
MDDRWNVRDSTDMDELRADLLGCPLKAVSAVIAEFSGDPVARLGVKVLQGPLEIRADRKLQLWREFLFNVIPSDGRQPHAPTVRKLLVAAEQNGWSDPRSTAPAAVT